MKRIKRFFSVIAVAAILLGVGIAVFQLTVKHRSVVAAIEHLESKDVERIIVYEGDSPRDDPRVVEDMEKIALLIESLKTGKNYGPNHDRNNGFERVVFIEPQHLQFLAYQREGVTDAIIVGLGEWTGSSTYRSFGHIRCALPAAWTQL